VNLNVLAAGASVSQTFPLAAPGHALTIDDVAAAGMAATAVFSSGANGLSSSVFGAWAINDGNNTWRIGAAAAGNPTASVPVTGTATYTGSTVGFGNINHQLFALAGNARLDADFGAGTVLPTFSNISARNLTPGVGPLPTVANGTLPTLTGFGRITGNSFSGS